MLALVEGANNAASNLPETEDKDFFDIKTKFMQLPLISRDDDTDEPVHLDKKRSKEEVRELSKEEDESLLYLGSNA